MSDAANSLALVNLRLQRDLLVSSNAHLVGVNAEGWYVRHNDGRARGPYRDHDVATLVAFSLAAPDLLDELGVYVPVSDDRPVEPPLAIPQSASAFVVAFAKLGHQLTPNGDDSFSLVSANSSIVIELANLEAVTQEYVALSRYRRLPGSTDLYGAYLRRSKGNPATLSAIRMWEDDKTWHPWWWDLKGQERAWDDEAYNALRTSLQSLPSGPLREAALVRIEILDCSGPCDPAAALVKQQTKPRLVAARRGRQMVLRPDGWPP